MNADTNETRSGEQQQQRISRHQLPHVTHQRTQVLKLTKNGGDSYGSGLNDPSFLKYSWLRATELNRHLQVQSLPSYLYSNPRYCHTLRRDQNADQIRSV